MRRVDEWTQVDTNGRGGTRGNKQVERDIDDMSESIDRGKRASVLRHERSTIADKNDQHTSDDDDDDDDAPGRSPDPPPPPDKPMERAYQCPSVKLKGGDHWMRAVTKRVPTVTWTRRQYHDDARDDPNKL